MPERVYFELDLVLTDGTTGVKVVLVACQETVEGEMLNYSYNPN